MKQKKPQVSVILTTYNRAGLLAKRSLPSVLSQTHEHFECLVVDDCSSDRTREVIGAVQKKDNRVKYIKLSQNSGVSAARNTGVQHAAGEYVAFLDDDDEFLPGFLETTLPILKKLSPEFGGVVTDRIYILNGNNKAYQPINLSGDFYQAISDGWLLRKSVFSKLSYDEELRVDENADFGIQFFSIFKAKAVSQPLLVVHAHKKEELGLSLPSAERLIALDRFLKKNLDLFKSRGSQKDLEFIYRFAGRNYCWGGKMSKGIPFLLKALFTKPSPRNVLNFLVSLLGHKAYVYYWRLERRLVHFLREHFLNSVNGKV